jgi:glycosyltransferase involved in cell wall biosynthesis
MKFAFIINNLASGGTENQVRLLVNEISKTFDISLILFSAENERETFFLNDINDKVNVINVTGVNKIHSILNLYLHLRKNNYDFCLNFNSSANLIIPLIFCLISSSVKVINNIRGDKKLNYRGIKFWQSMVDAIITNSNQIKGRLKSQYSINCPVNVIYNGVIINDDFNENHKINNLALCVGRINRVKNQKDILLAASELQNKIPHTFEIVGTIQDQDYYSELLALKKKLRIDNVKFIGEKKEISNYYNEADFVIISSISEGFPNVLLEAFSHDKIVFSSKVGEVPNIIKHNQNGYLYDAGKYKDLSKLIMHHLEKSDTEKLKMKENLRSEKHDFSIENKANELITFLKSL